MELRAARACLKLVDAVVLLIENRGPSWVKDELSLNFVRSKSIFSLSVNP